nr:hypothetical protein [Massilia glaciei]
MFDQELSFSTFAGAVKGGGEHQVGAGQKHTEQDLIGKSGAFDMASTQSETHGRGVGSD